MLLLGVAVALGFGILADAGYSAWWLAAPLAGIVALGVALDRIDARSLRVRRAILFYDHGLARLDGKWADNGPRGAGDDLQPLYAADLDLFGDGSLFQRLCTARTIRGWSTLSLWLLDAAPPDVVRARQAAVDELAAHTVLREDLAVLGAGRSYSDASELPSWGQAPPAFDSPRLLTAARIASVAGALALGAGVAWVLAAGRSLDVSAGVQSFLGWYFVAAVIGLALVRRRIRPVAEKVFAGAKHAAPDVALLGSLLGRLEAERFRAPRLVVLRALLDEDGGPPSRQAARLARLLEQVDSRRNAFARVFGFFLVWDVHIAHAIERWRRASGPDLAVWIGIVGEIEALCSLAAYRFERPGDVWPEFHEGAPRFEAEGLAHPLLGAEAVANDVRLDGQPQVLLVSGTNMSGKSTLLRAIGVNAVLAQAGAPVRAERLRMSPLAVGASIRITDSLLEGSSRFHAEIVRLRAILAAARGEAPPKEAPGETADGKAGAAADRKASKAADGKEQAAAKDAPGRAADGKADEAADGKEQTAEKDAPGQAAAKKAPDKPAPVLFLIDECLHGTNSDDRLVGARALIRSLVDAGAIGLVTTHDLALTQITDELGPRAANVHFTDQFADGKLEFDYRLRPGVVDKGNALDLMRSVGFDV